MADTVVSKILNTMILDIGDLVPFQGDLKYLSDEAYGQLKNQILKLGYSFVIHVWNDRGVYYVLDGHQRLRTLTRMRDEGYEIPPLTTVMVAADSYEQAKEKVLAGTSQYGQITGDGLYGFIADSGLDWRNVTADFKFPDIELPEFISSYYSESPIPQDTAPPARGDQGDGIHTFLNNDIRYIQLVYPISVYDRLRARLDEMCDENGCQDYSALIQKIAGVMEDENTQDKV